MKFASISLSNYIGIYNGMGLYEINIDLTKCKYRTLIIRGDNGSGKSTLSRAMNLFPDGTDNFIPGMSAKKVIVLIDNDVYYKLEFIHGIKQNGERETTKAYITKTFNGVAVELNENGNVSSYKDILYTELGLDSNFIALSQLGTEDRGLADKRPAERKKFVNSIISSLDTYNNIYKTLSKRSTSYKSMINAIVAKLNVLGDEKALVDNLEFLDSRINELQNSKDMAVEELAKSTSMISLLDPDGSIQTVNNSIVKELDNARKEHNIIQNTINRLSTSNDINLLSIEKDFEKIKNLKNSLSVQNQIDRNSIETLMHQAEQESFDIEEKTQKLRSLQSDSEEHILTNKMAEYELKMRSIEDEFSSKIGMQDVLSVTKDEYILALETLKDLDMYISNLKDSVAFEIIDRIITEYLSTGRIPEIDSSKTQIINSIYRLDDESDRLESELKDIQVRMGLLNTLNMRPKTCKDNTCGFIKDALEFSKTNPQKRIDEINNRLSSINVETDSLEESINKIDEYNNAVNLFSTIVREVNKNSTILSKLPNGDIFKDKLNFFDKMINGYSFEYARSIYRYIDLANLLDVYRITFDAYNVCKKDLEIFNNKKDVIESITKDIERINASVTALYNKINPIQDEILERELKIADLQKMENVYQSILAQLDKRKPLDEQIKNCESRLLDNSRKMNKINMALSKAASSKESIAKISGSLEPLMKERDKVLHSVQMLNDYKKELEELQNNYDFIEKIKYYSSPTTGIQLVFMELYMGKVIALANELLQLLFKGEFVIQPFVINESEFRIPCLGGGYINDDISSMSNAQISMISMILSFALLHHSSTKYNIIKLDEIDGPLDYSNRLLFADVLNSIMDIMSVEQCIMISHNSELQIDQSDVILLKHDPDNMEYRRGNIIWSY